MTKLGHHLREWRRFRGLTQQQLASVIDIGRPYLSRIERGENDYMQYIIERIAIALDCNVGDLVDINPLGPDEYFSVAEKAVKFDFENLKTRTMPEKRSPKKAGPKPVTKK